eukprot:324842_1
MTRRTVFVCATLAIFLNVCFCKDEVLLTFPDIQELKDLGFNLDGDQILMNPVPVSGEKSSQSASAHRANLQFTKGKLALNEGKYTDAIRYISEAIDLATPGVSEYDTYFHLLSIAYLWEKNFEKAAEAAMQGLKKFPEHEDTIRDAAYAYYKLSRWDDALTHHRKLITLNPTSMEDHRHLGENLVRLKMWQECTEVLGTIVEADREDFEAMHMMGTCQRKIENFDSAEKYYMAARVLEPENDELLFALAEMYNEKGDYKAAIEWQSKLTKKYPNNQFYTSKLMAYKMTEQSGGKIEFDVEVKFADQKPKKDSIVNNIVPDTSINDMPEDIDHDEL